MKRSRGFGGPFTLVYQNPKDAEGGGVLLAKWEMDPSAEERKKHLYNRRVLHYDFYF